MIITPRVPGASAAPSAISTLDLSSPDSYVLNGHATPSATALTDGFYRLGWTGIGGNATDTLSEQLLMLFQVPLLDGALASLAARTHVLVLSIDIDPGAWPGTNSQIVCAGAVAFDGTTYGSPGSPVSGACFGFLAGGSGIQGIRIVNGSNLLFTATAAETAVVVYFPDPSTSGTPIVGGFCADYLDASGANVASQPYVPGDSLTDGDLITVAVGLGTDASLNSNAMTADVRVRAGLIPIPTA